MDELEIDRKKGEIFNKYLVDDYNTYGTVKGLFFKEKFTANMILGHIYQKTSPRIRKKILVEILQEITTKKQMQLFCREYVKIIQKSINRELNNLYQEIKEDCNL
jgi:hypothetical protein